MSRRSIIICICALILMLGGISAAVAVLYSDGNSGKEQSPAQVADDSRFILLPAVPSDAVALFCFSKASDAWEMTPFKDFGCRMTVSLHYSGKLTPLYVFDMGRSSKELSSEGASLVEYAQGLGLVTEYVDCSAYPSLHKKIGSRSIVLASPSEVIVRSSIRHLEKNVSVLDLSGFPEAASQVQTSDVMIVSNEQSSKLLGTLLGNGFGSWSDFATRLSSWTVADIDCLGKDGIVLNGKAVSDDIPSMFMSVLKGSACATSAFTSVLPSYTYSALSLPMKDVEAYLAAYSAFLDSKQQLQNAMARSKALKKENGLSPQEFFAGIGVREVATASFISRSSLQRVNLIRCSNPDAELIFKDCDTVPSLKDYSPALHPFAYPSYLGSAFGNLFNLKDESCFTYVDGWIISGSKEAVEEYTEGRALEYTLKEYLSDASLPEIPGSKSSVATAFLSVSSVVSSPEKMFRKSFLSLASGFTKDADLVPLVLTVGTSKDHSSFHVELKSLKLRKTKAPAFDRDTTVVIPQGPFEVRNSGTGKTNFFYQQDNLYLCLKEEGGKGLWGIPFDKKICGTTCNVDYYANGKIQFLFGAGSKIYLIDRLGRFVKGFPVDLGKEILIGPDVYDFNSTNKYNIMVLHKDKTIEMYNLKGQKPSSWKGIKSEETIKSLPERLILGDKSCWVVRTSIRTMIYPFNGGEALTREEGDKMIRPDSKVRVIDDNTIEFECYDGKTRKLVL